MMVVHYTFFRNDEKLGWGQYENKEFLIAQNEAIRDFFTSCKDQILDVFHPKNWTKANFKAIYLSKIPTEDTGYFILGSYAVLTIMPTLYNSKHYGIQITTSDWNWVGFTTAFLAAVAIATYPIWPISVKQRHRDLFVRIIWYPAIFAILFMQSFFWIVTGFAAVQAVVLFFTMSFMSYVFGWRFTLVSFSALMYLAIQAYKYYTGLEIFRVETRIGEIFMFLYMLALVFSFVIFLARPREIYIRYLRRTVGGLKEDLDKKDRIICETEHLASQTEDARYALAHEMHRIANAKNEEIREITIANQKKLAEAEEEKQKALKIAAKGKKQIRSMAEKEEALVMAISAIREDKRRKRSSFCNERQG